jgi:hypothetical protein
MEKTKADCATLFVCLKLRGSDEASCARRGGREILEQLRSEIDQSGDARIAVRPSGCLKKCEKGPAIAAFLHKNEQGLSKPPKKAWKKAAVKWKGKKKTIGRSDVIIAEIRSALDGQSEKIKANKI